MSRLHSLLSALPTASLPPFLLDVGCGDDASNLTIRTALPAWTLYGIDLDHAALLRARQQKPAPHLIQADARHLPGLLHSSFGLILVRHPDLFRHRAAWSQIIPTLPASLAPGGFLVITLYAPEEVEFIRTLPLPPAYQLDEHALAAPDLAGHDRFLRVVLQS
jgi:trans-aconitate methyltransferase